MNDLEQLIAETIAATIARARTWAEAVATLPSPDVAPPGMEAQVASIKRIATKAREFVDAINEGRDVCDAWAARRQAGSNGKPTEVA
jgi:hypothetical protein